MRSRYLGIVAALVFTNMLLAQTYTVTDVGVLPDKLVSWGTSVDNLGHVAGFSTDTVSGNGQIAFAWGPARGMVGLGALTGGTFSWAFGINRRLSVVGGADVALFYEHAFLWKPDSGMQDLGTLPGDTYSRALAINNSEEVVGISFDWLIGPVGHAFSWTPENGLEALPLVPGDPYSSAAAINENGWIAGSSFTHALVWSPTRSIIDLGTLPGGTWSRAVGLNARAQVVGVSTNSEGRPHAFFWSKPTGMQDLGVLYPEDFFSMATGINNAGQVVGYSSGVIMKAFLWSREKGMQDLTSLVSEPDWTFLGYPGIAINERGQIVCTGGNPKFSAPHAVLLTPNY